jgi:hypothetical protein
MDLISAAVTSIIVSLLVTIILTQKPPRFRN